MHDKNKNKNHNKNSGNKYQSRDSHNKNNGHKNENNKNDNSYKGRDKYKRRDNRGRQKTIEEHERDYISKKRSMPGEKPLCPICEKEIYLIEQSIRHKETGKPAHFDCILKFIRENNELENSESIVYLGGGSFGIIKERHGKGVVKFFVRKRIMYENRENTNRKENDDHDEEENI